MSKLTRGGKDGNELRIPILKLEKLTDDTVTTGRSSKSKVRPGQRNHSPDIAESPPPADNVFSERRMRRSNQSTSTVSNNDTAPPNKNSENEQNSECERKRKNSSTEPRNIIRSIFAKPDSRRRRAKRTKIKSSSKKSAPKQHGQFLKIKFKPTKKSKINKFEEEKSDSEMDVSQQEQEDDANKKIDSNETDADDESGEHQLSGPTNDEPQTNEDTNSKRSDDEDDLFTEMDQDDWKPMRAAMVAAMELVAKKQVTDDMRAERRVRKYNKPLPPKGRGRRTIYKRMNKPVQSCQETHGPMVTTFLYHEKIFHQVGDIVCLVQDLDEEEPVPKLLRYFQVRGFLQTSIHGQGDCASLLYLERNPNADFLEALDENKRLYTSGLNIKTKLEEITSQNKEVPQSIISPSYFNPLHYSPGSYPEILVEMKYLKLVAHCPADLYSGHDTLFNKLTPQSVYMRLGCPILDYDRCSGPSNPPKARGGQTEEESDNSTSTSTT